MAAGDGLRLFSKSLPQEELLIVIFELKRLLPIDQSDVSYHIVIKTGSVNGASSDSRVFVKLYGEKGDTNKMTLAVSDNDLRNYFETGRTDIFTIETSDIGQVSDGVCPCFLSSSHPRVSSLLTDQPSSDWTQ